MPPPPPTPTSVTLLLTSTANDQFSEFNIDIASFTLTNKAGASVSLIPAIQNNGIYQTQNVDFVHLNTTSAPLVTAIVPQDVYTSASLTYTYTQFTYIFLNSNGGVNVTTNAGGQANAIPIAATVNLPSPITVSGPSMGLLLNLQQSASATLTKNVSGGPDTYSITPNFTLASVPIATQSELAKLIGLDGRITSTSSTDNKITLKTVNGYSRPTAPAGSLFAIATDTSTIYQGIRGFSALATGTFVNVDLALQPDGSFLATRIEVEDANATNEMIGPIANVYCTCIASTHSLLDVGNLQQGSDLDNNPIDSWGYSYDASTVFRISQQSSIPANLPFPATFDASSVVAGQYVSLSSLAISSSVRATTITLRPQTINGTVTAVSNVGGFSVYSVSLAPYDLFPTLAVQPGQTTVLNNPSVVEVYADSSTQLLNTNSLAPGSVLRFHGDPRRSPRVSFEKSLESSLHFDNNDGLRGSVACARGFSTRAKPRYHPFMSNTREVVQCPCPSVPALPPSPGLYFCLRPSSPSIRRFLIFNDNGTLRMDCNLSDQAVREAYFLGQRHDDSMARLLNRYTKFLPTPPAGPHIYSVTFLTPFALLVRHSSQQPNYSAQQAAKDHHPDEEIVVVEIQIFLTPSYSATIPAPTNSRSGASTGYQIRPSDFWKDFDTTVLDGKKELIPTNLTGEPTYTCVGEGACHLSGATVRIEFTATAFTSDSALIEVLAPEGDLVTVDFDLSSLR